MTRAFRSCKLLGPMPAEAPEPKTTLEELVAQVDRYPIEAFVFVNEAVAHTVRKIHGERTSPEQNMHVSGRQLCDGFRELAIVRWGMLAGTVLRRWNMRSTADIGRIVFAMVEHNFMSKTDQDSPEDFREVYDFRAAFDPAGYCIASRA